MSKESKNGTHISKSITKIHTYLEKSMFWGGIKWRKKLSTKTLGCVIELEAGEDMPIDKVIIRHGDQIKEVTLTK